MPKVGRCIGIDANMAGMTGARPRATEFIASKFRVPQPPATVNERTRLVDQLVATTCPVVLIEAPAGYGIVRHAPGTDRLCLTDQRGVCSTEWALPIQWQ